MRFLLLGVVLLVGAGLILPYFLDVDRYRTLIASVIETETGRKVTIGRIRARLLPRVGFVMEDFRLSNPPGFPDGDLLTVEAIRGNLALRPLLQREIRLYALELVRPKLVLLEDDRGQTNYSLPAGAGLPSGKRTKAADTPVTKPIHLSDIERIDLTDAEVTLAQLAGHDRPRVPSLQVRKLSLRLDHLALYPLEIKRWQGDARLTGVIVELAGWKGPIELRSGSLTLREGGMDSDFRASLGKAGEFKGSVRVADIEHAVPTFQLSTAELDVDQLLAGMATTAPAAPRPRTKHSELVAQGRLAAERLHWSSYTANNAAAEVRLFGDRAELWPVTIQLYGGSLQISARADRAAVPERFSANVQVRNVDVAKLLSTSPGTRGKLTGTGELTLQLFGALGPEWQKSLSGSGTFAIHDGRLPGVNLTGGLDSVARAAGLAGDTPFTAIRGDLAIAQARVSSRQIHLDASRLTADLHGSCSLNGSLDYDGQAVVTPSAGTLGSGQPNPVDAVAGILGGVLKRNVSRVTVPFSIRGTLHDPKFQPGRGLPTIEQPTPAQPTQAQPKKEPSILDLFRRRP